MPLTQEELETIQRECFADDVPIHFEEMRLWSSDEARGFFEAGGELPADGYRAHESAATMVSLGACLPNAPVPLTRPPAAAVDTAADASSSSSSSSSADASASVPPEDDAGRIFCVSDLHTDHAPNLEWCRALRDRAVFRRDVLVVAGDVTSSIVLLRETLEILVAAFGTVFYVPGNHDLWVKGRGLSGGLHVRPTPIDSLQKLDEILELCGQLGVETQPAYARGAIVAPLLAWYHASWDTEPDVSGWTGIPPAEAVMVDFHACKWPPPLSSADDSIAIRLDTLNDGRVPGARPTQREKVEALRAAHPAAPLITLSHFVPRIELTPEKRFLFFPPLAKAVGSVHLAARIAALRPAVHVFGHTHFGWDATLDDGVRYLQAPLAYPDERAGRLGTIATGETFPHGEPPTPLLVYDAVARAFPMRYDAGWSNFYAKYPRRPELSHLVAPYVASRYKRVDGVGQVGWLAEGDNPTMSPEGEPTPAWALGPTSALSVEKNVRATGRQLGKT